MNNTTAFAAALSAVAPSERPVLVPLERACLRGAGFERLLEDDDALRAAWVEALHVACATVRRSV